MEAFVHLLGSTIIVKTKDESMIHGCFHTINSEANTPLSIDLVLKMAKVIKCRNQGSDLLLVKSHKRL